MRREIEMRSRGERRKAHGPARASPYARQRSHRRAPQECRRGDGHREARRCARVAAQGHFGNRRRRLLGSLAHISGFYRVDSIVNRSRRHPLLPTDRRKNPKIYTLLPRSQSICLGPPQVLNSSGALPSTRAPLPHTWDGDDGRTHAGDEVVAPAPPLAPRARRQRPPAPVCARGAPFSFVALHRAFIGAVAPPRVGLHTPAAGVCAPDVARRGRPLRAAVWRNGSADLLQAASGLPLPGSGLRYTPLRW